MFWIVSYDIANDKRRYRVSKILESYGTRAQYSVFECEISDRQQMALAGELREVVDLEEDDVRFYPMNAADIKRVKTLGPGKLNRWGSHIII